ncbi:unnamed protein product [Nezara viridula]|uniref:Neuropeptide n=1 Tax=Nezara viridula TaxID=85310 RepID=A0A9P0H984_NEZVI|nr:unnamed protein product [Nezara viridula]
MILVISIVIGFISTPTLGEGVSTLTAKTLNNSANVRTVLFRDTDTCKVCWSKEDLNLLVARRLVQDLIPRKIPRDFPALYTYLKDVIETVKAKSNEKNLHTMLLATYDALGGYLHAIAIPILNEAFYAGNVDFTTTSNLHTLLGTMMAFLGTNGNGWAPPCDMRRIPTKVAALPIRMCKTVEACDAFVINNRSSSSSVGSDECEPGSSSGPSQESKIQIPFLDDNAYPSAIAVPLKEHPLFSLMSECAVNIVPKYYILAMRCLSSPSYSNKDIINFNRQLHRWIIATVVPHLHEIERWYPGFGSIMRVVETMNQRGLASTEIIKIDTKESNRSVCIDLPPSSVCSWSFNVVPWLIIAAIVLIALIIAICCVRCCINCIRSRRSNEADAKDHFTNTLVNLYCGIKGRQPPFEGGETSQGRSRRGFGSSAPSYEGESSDDYETE